MPKAERVGVVEVGSRAVRLLVADVEPDGGLRVEHTSYEELPLMNVALRGDREEIDALVSKVREVVERFLAIARDAKAQRTAAFGTEAVRRLSAKSEDLLHEVPELRVLDARTEALCSLAAALQSARSSVPEGGALVAIDQGAGSVELARGGLSARTLELSGFKSYRLGTEALVNLLQRADHDLDELRRRVEVRIRRWNLAPFEDQVHCVVLGSAATKAAWLTVRKEDERYDPRRVDGHSLTLRSVDSLVGAANEQPRVIRAAMEPGGASSQEFDRVMGGLVALSVLLHRLGLEGFTVSALGTRYGLAWLLATSHGEQIAEV